MKRDLDLIREILIQAENTDTRTGNPVIPERTDDEVAHHVWLLLDAGLVTGGVSTTIASKQPEATLGVLTSAGHDFLDDANKSAVWAKVKAVGAALTLAGVKALLSEAAREMLRRP